MPVFYAATVFEEFPLLTRSSPTDASPGAPAESRATSARPWCTGSSEPSSLETHDDYLRHSFASRAAALGDAEPFDALVNCCQAIADKANPSLPT